ncbi:MAG: GNAT family acetyltransferase [Rhodobacteraceae bacterium]|nr:GNAT family acetyltransferase [Paracoccaceae bacterium]
MTIEYRLLAPSEIGDAVKLWKACGLTRPWNNPFADARRALAGPSSTIVASFAAGHLIGTAMCGWDGHRGWIYYLGVDSDFRRWGVGRELIRHCEDWLGQFGAPKVQLVVRAENNEVGRFYEAIGYEEESFRFFYRRITAKRHSEQQSEAP